MTETPEAAPLPAYDQLAEALAAFQAEMPTVAKKHTATVKSDKGSYSYTYAGLADVSEAAMPLLAKHGLSFITLPGNGLLTGMLLHSSGQTLTASLPIGSGTPQQVGSSLTYMRRYLLGCMTGLVTDDDDDGRNAQAAPRTRKRAEPAPRAQESPVDPWAKPESEGGVRTAGGASAAQIKNIARLMGKANIDTREGALLYVNDLIGRTVESRNELTSKEASAVISALKIDTGESGEQS